jgi:hypothetical protein
VRSYSLGEQLMGRSLQCRAAIVRRELRKMGATPAGLRLKPGVSVLSYPEKATESYPEKATES